MYKIKPKTKRNLQRLIPFGLIWFLSGWVFSIVEQAASNDLDKQPVTVIEIDLQIFIFASIALVSVGFLMGFIELKYLGDKFTNKRFAVRILYKLLIYFSLFFIVVLILFPIAASLELNTSVLDRQVWDRYFIYLNSFTYLSTMLQLAIAMILSLFYSEISEIIGQGVLINFFTGKYHRPTEEERIFMFLDMKSSTTIAEKLGHLEYFRLLRAYYDCFSDAIIEHEGEIYQYVGDEIILSWKFKSGRSNSRCIDCFFAMKENLEQKEDWFKAQFDTIPTFKAGIHFGKVTIGEIGDIKKDIMFTGDVLNATARIQGLCNSYAVDLIISGDLVKQLEFGAQYELRFLGEGELRGKYERKELYTVNLRN